MNLVLFAEAGRDRGPGHHRVLLAAGVALEQDLRDAYQAGMNDFVSKPLIMDEVARIIAGVEELTSPRSR